MHALRNLLGRAKLPVLAVVTAFLIGAIVIVLTDYEHLKDFGTDPLGAIGAAIDVVIRGYATMFTDAIGDPGRILTALQSGNERDIAGAIRPISETLVNATPFIFVGLGAAIAFHAGLLNLGGNGQFAVGGFGAVLTASLVAGLLPPFLALVVGIVGGTLFGAAYGFVPGFLKARTGAHEVITTLMLNPIAQAIPFLVIPLIPFSGPPGPMPEVPRLTDIPTIRVDWSFVAALGMAAVVSILLYRTTLGFELRATGFSRTATRVSGMQPGLSMIRAMSLSGGLAGMGAAFLTLGLGSRGDVGLVSLAIAMIAGLRPGRIVLVALLFGALNNGAKSMVIETGIPLALLVVIIALAMMFVAAPGVVRSIWRVKATDAPGLAGFRPVGPGEQL